MRNKPLMAYRSNRRWQNPRMSVAVESGKAIGSRRANSPLWSLPENGRSSKRPNIREQSYLQVKDGMFANEEESIYGQHDSGQPNNSGEILKAPVIKKSHKKANGGARYANKASLKFAHQCLSKGFTLRQLLAEKCHNQKIKIFLKNQYSLSNF